MSSSLLLVVAACLGLCAAQSRLYPIKQKGVCDALADSIALPLHPAAVHIAPSSGLCMSTLCPRTVVLTPLVCGGAAASSSFWCSA
jgi:hypothetical protein